MTKRDAVLKHHQDVDFISRHRNGYTLCAEDMEYIRGYRAGSSNESCKSTAVWYRIGYKDGLDFADATTG